MWKGWVRTVFKFVLKGYLAWIRGRSSWLGVQRTQIRSHLKNAVGAKTAENKVVLLSRTGSANKFGRKRVSRLLFLPDSIFRDDFRHSQLQPPV